MVVTIADKNDEGTYVTDISSYRLEALLTYNNGPKVKGWSSEEGTITFDSVAVPNVGRKGVAIFRLTGEESAALDAGLYSLELARVFPDGRAIGVLSAAVEISRAQIKEGI